MTAAQAQQGFEIEGLQYAVDGQALIKGIDLSLGRSGITMLLGPNGAGKSLLLKLIHGLLTPSQGRITWQGQPLGPATRKRQAMVFQKPVLLRRSVAKNMDFALQVKGIRDPARRDALLEQAGLLELARRPARRLSGGEQQRLALARALALEPEVLFLDEPTASLDPASVLMIEDSVRRACDAGMRIIFVTHDTAQARRLGDDVAFLHRGTLAEHSPADTFFTTPESEAAQSYLDGRILV